MELGIILFSLLALAQSRLIDLSCKQIKGFVDGHNMRRLRLAKGEVYNQPAASEMKFMMWDAELAAKAANWAAKHKFIHNPNKKIASNRFTTGENLYMYSTTDRSYTLDPSSALDSWFDEYKDYTFAPLTARDFDGSRDEQIGHYTQMAWADTTYVGCAVSEKFENGWKKILVVCNYGPSGNYLGRTPYRPGSPSGSLVCGTQDCRRPYGKC
ncbi:venom allergen 5-like [Epargyreus clarus]|uniref:venom allergen 5-like n=1 Tax=Epargyreus clarus TaxID=520877 RepID=UPI003C2D1F9C